MTKQNTTTRNHRTTKNTRNFQSAKSLTNTEITEDENANVHTHKYFTYRLSEEIRRSTRIDKSFSILLLHFTDLHKIPDSNSEIKTKYIREMGQEIRKTLRAYDVICMNPTTTEDPDPWELELILPGTTWEESESIADRMTKLVSDKEVNLEGTFTFSSEARIGIAGFPENGQNRDQLINTGREALKKAMESDDRSFRALVPETLNESAEELYEKTIADKPWYQRIVGQSPVMKENVFQMVEQIISTNFNVIIEGEPGTGKELIARVLHDESPRKEQPFVSINCSKYSVTLLKQKLFGNVSDSTQNSASGQDQGLLEQANGGTLFLEEISEMSKGLQAQLLRILESGELRRTGSEEAKSIDVRIICSSTSSIEQLLSTGEFRQELYYRLNDTQINVPPLRERIEDIPLLIKYFLEEVAFEKDQAKKDIEEAAIRKLMKREWTGNVKELRNEVRRLALTVEEDTIRADSIQDVEARNETTEDPEESGKSEGERDFMRIPIPQEMKTSDLKIWKERAEAKIDRMALKEALKRTDGDRMEASEILDLHFTSVYRKIRQYEIDA